MISESAENCGPQRCSVDCFVPPRKLGAMNIEREYEIVLQPEPQGGFSVFVPELPSVATQGETIEEAREMAKEAVETYLEVMHKDGLTTPTVHRRSVAVPA